MEVKVLRPAAWVLGVALVVGSTGFLLQAEPPQEVDTWASIGTSDPQAARTGAAIATLPDRTTLVAGGLTAEGTVTDSIVIHDPLTNASTAAGQLLEPRVGAAATTLDDGRILITGGQVGSLISSDVEIFDPATGESTFAALLQQPRTGHASALLADGTVLIVGGTTVDGVVLATTERFDPSTNSVSAAEPMAAARTRASATTLIDGRVLVAGGHDGAQDLASAEIYSPTDGAFLPVPTQMSEVRSGHSAVLLPHNNSVLIAGGTSAGTSVRTTDLFLPAMFPDPYSWGMGSFGPTNPMVQPRSHAVAGPWGDDGYAFAMGGGSGDGEVYRFATIKTDKDDYAPGEPAVITGSGWAPLEEVTLTFQEDPAVHEDYVLTLTADDEGNIYHDQWAPEQHDANVRFYLMATGAESRRRAQMTFTDSVSSTTIVTPTGFSTVSVAPGGTVSVPYAFTYVTGGSGTTTGTSGPTTSITYNVYLRLGGTDYLIAGPVTQTGLSNGMHSVGSAASPLFASVTFNGVGSNPPGTGGEGYSLKVDVIKNNGSNPASNSDTENNWVNVTAASGSVASVAVGTQSASRIYGQSTGNVTYAVDATRAANGNFTGNYGVSGLPSGVSLVSFVPLAADATGSAPLVDTTLTLQVASTVPAGTYNFTVTLGGVNGTGTLVVGKADATFAVTGYAVTYDGQPHTATVSMITGVNGETGATVGAVDVTGTTHTDAGTYNDSWTFTGTANYNDIGATPITNEIDKANAVVVVTPYDVTYDGQPHTAEVTSITGVNGETGGTVGAVDVTGTTHTNAGTYNDSWTFTGTANYQNIAATPITNEIDKATATFTVSGYNVTFDGQSHTAEVTSITGVNGETGATVGTVDLSGTTHTNAGIYANDPWSFTGGANYSDDSGTVDSEIAKANAACTITGYSGTFDAATHGATGSCSGVTLDPSAAGSTLDLGASFTDVPGGTANWTFEGGTNYLDESGSVEIVINQADALVTVSGTTVTYDGNAHGATGTATGVGGVDLSAGLSLGGSFTDVPGGTANWTFEGGTNYLDESGSVAIVINQKALTVSGVTANDKPFDGNTTATLNLGAAALVGVVSPDMVTLNTAGATGTFASHTVGAHVVTIAGLTIGGADVGNYSLTQPTTTASITAWKLSGYLSPVGISNTYLGMPNVSTGTIWNTVKGGQTVPLKFEIFTAVGGTELTSVSNVSGFTLVSLPCTPGTEDPVDVTLSTPGSTILNYDGSQFHLNWQTPKGTSKCYRMTMTAIDGSQLTAFFKAK